MSTTLKDWLKQTIAELEEERDATPGAVNEDAAMALAAMKLALASLEAEIHSYTFEDDPRPLYTAPPEPVVPDECPVEIRDLLASHSDALFHDGDAQAIWNACRAAMLQGTDGNIGKPLTIKLPDISSKAFWSGTGKNETFHPETYRRWVKEAIETSCTIARVNVEVK
ncbi:hypothetical protein [Enterobacter hormaechei]|uniref:hypothetical protein n=1 Tax=Enterobacter hormaechei TaxID=158836 RepID=UPI001FD784E0|nr:hypothetical protein [Enterobacter hormaechei]